MMKKLILTLMTIPFFGFGQSKTEKVATQVGAAAVVTAGVIGLFKKKKDKNDTSKTQNTTEGKISTNTNGMFSVNTKPEDIISSVYKCTYKKLKTVGEEENFCVWKPTITDFDKLKQNVDEYEYKNWIESPKVMFATEIDTILTFKQKGIDNIIIVTKSDNYSDKEELDLGSGNKGFTRFQTTDGKQMKLVSNDKIITGYLTMMFDKTTILQIDDENIFYNVPYTEGGAGGHTEHYNNIYSLDGKYLLGYQSSSDSSNYDTGGYSESKTEMKIDGINKTFKLIESSSNYNKKGKLLKSTKEIVAAYQYGNGMITEIKQTLSSKNQGKKKQ